MINSQISSMEDSFEEMWRVLKNRNTEKLKGFVNSEQWEKFLSSRESPKGHTPITYCVDVDDMVYTSYIFFS